MYYLTKYRFSEAEKSNDYQKIIRTVQSRFQYSYPQALQVVYLRMFSTASRPSPSISGRISMEDGGCSVQSKRATGASVMTSAKGIHIASPTQEPLSQRMSDSGAGEYTDRAFLMTDNQGDNPRDIREKTLMATIEGIHKLDNDDQCKRYSCSFTHTRTT